MAISSVGQTGIRLCPMKCRLCLQPGAKPGYHWYLFDPPTLLPPKLYFDQNFTSTKTLLRPKLYFDQNFTSTKVKGSKYRKGRI